MAKNNNVDPGGDEVEEKKQQAKFKSRLKAAGRKMARAIGRLLRPILPFLIVPLLMALLVTIAVFVIKDFFDSLGDAMEGASNYQMEASEGADTEYEKLRDWYDRASPTSDPDHTDSILKMLDKAEEGDEKAIEAAAALVRGDLQMMSKEDFKYIIESCSYDPDRAEIANANSRMFKRADVNYTYHTWYHLEDPETGAWYWTESISSPINISEMPYDAGSHTDGMYGNETGLDTEGLEAQRKVIDEIDGSEKTITVKKYATHWQDVATLAAMAGLHNYDNWQNTGDPSNYVAGNGDVRQDDTDGYFISDETLNKILSFFNYKFEYYYDALTDMTHDTTDHGVRGQYDFRKLEKGQYKVGYHLYKEDVEPAVNTHPPTYSFNTYYTPESAPKQISNVYETVTYNYCSTKDVPNYIPAGDVYNPPVGQYCCGMWDVVDPEKLIEAFATVLTDYSGRESAYDDKNTWQDNMMDDYIENLSEMPDSKLYGQPEYYKYLKNLYDKKFVLVSYKGTRAGEYAKQLANLQATYAAKDVTILYPLAVAGTQSLEDVEKGVPQGWTCDINLADMGSGTFYTVNVTNVNASPFHAYGVTFVNGSGGSGGSGGNGHPSQHVKYGQSVVIITAESGGVTHYYPDVDRDNVFIDPETGERYGVCPIDNDALINLYNVSDNMTLEQVGWVMDYFDELFGGKYPFKSATEAVYNWQQEKGQSISAVLAFIIPEGTYNTGSANSIREAEHWNFWNFMAGSSDPYFVNSSAEGAPHWLDVKAKVNGNFVEGLLFSMNKVVDLWFVKRGQTTYYDMSFHGYGFPTTLEEAKQAGEYFNCYCPWWGVPAFMSTGDEVYLYPNLDAAARRTLLAAAGINNSGTVAGKLEECADWYITNIPDYDQKNYTYVDSYPSCPFPNISTWGEAKVRRDCSGFASAFVASLVPDQTVYTCNSATFDENYSVGKALLDAGWHKVWGWDIASYEELPTGTIFVAPGNHVEIFVSSNGDGTINTFGWGDRYSSYPSWTGSAYIDSSGAHFMGKTYEYIWTY